MNKEQLLMASQNAKPGRHQARLWDDKFEEVTPSQRLKKWNVSAQNLYMPETHSVQQSIRKVQKNNPTSYTHHRPSLWLWEAKSCRGAKLGECFRNPHSTLTLRGSYTPALSQAAFLSPAGVCSASDRHSFLTKATHKNQSQMSWAFLKWQGNHTFFPAPLPVVPYILFALCFWLWGDVFVGLSARIFCFSRAQPH